MGPAENVHALSTVPRLALERSYYLIRFLCLLALTACATSGTTQTLGFGSRVTGQDQSTQAVKDPGNGQADTLPLVFAGSDGDGIPRGAQSSRIGWVYRIEGYLDGQPVRYVGSAADLKERLSRRKHQWSALLRQESTKVYAVEVSGDLNIQESNRQTAWSARNEALRAAEQRVLDKLEKDVGRANQHRASGEKEIAILNKDKASVDAALWEARHKVSVGKQWRLVSGRVAGGMSKAVGILAVLEAFHMYRESKLAQAIWAPYVLEDEKGFFILLQRTSLFSSEYFKKYTDGEFAGQQVELSLSEFRKLRDEAEALWGTTDWNGDFVPGLLLRELPVISIDPELAVRQISHTGS